MFITHLSIRGCNIAVDLLNKGNSGLCDVMISNLDASSKYIANLFLANLIAKTSFVCLTIYLFSICQSPIYEMDWL